MILIVNIVQQQPFILICLRRLQQHGTDAVYVVFYRFDTALICLNPLTTNVCFTFLTSMFGRS